MKRLTAVFLCLALLFSCAFAGEAAETVDYTTGTPWLCIDLEGVVTADTPVNAKDNYALWANKDKILAMEIPTGYPEMGAIMGLVLKQAEDVKNMFLGDAPEGHDALLAYNLFQLMMDWDSRNALGIQPLKEETDAVEAIGSIDALTAYYLETPAEEQAASLWKFGIQVDLTDSSRYILAIDSRNLLLGDSAEYTKLTGYGEIKKKAYTDLARKMLIKLGYTEVEAEKKIENCLAFEGMFASSVYTAEEKGRADYNARTNNIYTREQLLEAQGNLPILQVLEKWGYPEADRYQVVNPVFLARMSELYTEENLPLIKDFLIVRDAVSSADILDRECYEWNCEAVNAVSGASGILDDETAFSSAVAEKLKWPVGQLYTETYLKKEDKERITGVVEEILEAYHGILEEADFLSDKTREKAIEKLESIRLRVLWPENWERYSCEGLEIASPAEGGTLWKANRAITRWSSAKSLKSYSEPIDPEEWDEPPQTVNCFYDPQDNSICIMGAFAQGSFYRSDMRDEELYATLGMVIGHEISHAFDREGAQFDKDGNMVNWWTEEDYAAFLEKNAKLEAYYNAMHPWQGQDFKGAIMTGEACADMAGLKVALRIAKGKENFDYDLFFRSYAGIWATKETLQRAYSRINDNHPMPYLRINATLQQFDEFLNFYDIREGDAMYLAPEDRVSIW